MPYLNAVALSSVALSSVALSSVALSAVTLGSVTFLPREKKRVTFAYPPSMENSKEHSVENNVGCK